MSNWWNFSAKNVETEDEQGGVYEFGNSSKQVVYIGSTNDMKRRLQEHLSGSDSCIARNASYYRVDYRTDYKAEERRRYDAYERTHRVSPLCNDRRP